VLPSGPLRAYPLPPPLIRYEKSQVAHRILATGEESSRIWTADSPRGLELSFGGARNRFDKRVSMANTSNREASVETSSSPAACAALPSRADASHLQQVSGGQRGARGSFFGVDRRTRLLGRPMGVIRLDHTQEVGGSSPSTPMLKTNHTLAETVSRPKSRGERAQRPNRASRTVRVPQRPLRLATIWSLWLAQCEHSLTENTRYRTRVEVW
jgi:hypothetical protein